MLYRYQIYIYINMLYIYIIIIHHFNIYLCIYIYICYMCVCVFECHWYKLPISLGMSRQFFWCAWALPCRSPSKASPGGLGHFWSVPGKWWKYHGLCMFLPS